jgi:hypothetical protein
LTSFVRKILQEEENKGVEFAGDGERKLEGRNWKAEKWGCRRVEVPESQETITMGRLTVDS